MDANTVRELHASIREHAREQLAWRREHVSEHYDLKDRLAQLERDVARLTDELRATRRECETRH